MAVVDIHSHAIPPKIVDAIESDPIRFMARIEDDGSSRRVVHNQGYAYPLFEEFTDPKAKLRAMDRKGIDTSVLSPPPPLFYYWADPEVATQTARLVNDGIAGQVAENPERFRGMATVPMQDAWAAVEELERVVTVHGFRAVEIGTSIEGRQLADKEFRPVLERASELGVFVLAHPYYVGAKQGLEDYYLTNLLGNPYDSTVMIANLMFSGLLDELPDLKICVAHGGGFVPYQIGRLQHGHGVRPETRASTKTPPSELLGRLFFDTITFNPLALRYLLDLVGADHVALGTDAPFDMGDEEPLETVGKIPTLTDRERDVLLSGTAETLLGKD
ncbi:MAG: amidohydrolase family protein [Rubrobacteraceae bacterium]